MLCALRERRTLMITTSDFIDGKLSQLATLLASRRDAFFDDPDDIETNHKLRVSVRTARSLIDFLKPWQNRKQNKFIQQNLKAVVGETSRLRELDVFAQLAKSLDPASPELVAFCENEAAVERARVLETLAMPSYAERFYQAIEELDDIKWKPSVIETGLDPAFVRNKFDVLTDGLQADLEALDVSDYEQMHSIRKRTKQVRYVAEQFNGIIGEDVLRIAKRMKSQQDDLGALCDSKVNRELVGSYLTRADVSELLARELVRLI